MELEKLGLSCGHLVAPRQAYPLLVLGGPGGWARPGYHAPLLGGPDGWWSFCTQLAVARPSPHISLNCMGGEQWLAVLGQAIAPQWSVGSHALGGREGGCAVMEVGPVRFSGGPFVLVESR